MLDFFYSVDEKNRVIQNTVLEFCDESLEHVIQKVDREKNFIPMETIKKYANEIFTGLKEMHDLGIAHRDLKPENVLLFDGEVRIADVGSSKSIIRGCIHKARAIATLCCWPPDN